jgi:amino acid transporter
VNVGLPHLIAAGLIILVWAFNIFGIRVAVWFGYVTGALLMIPLAVFIIGPFVTGNWHASNLHFGMAGTPLTLKLALVWLYVMGWSSYGVETCAAFAPEYKDTVHDTNLALKTAALFSLLVYALLPMGITGAIGEQAAVKDPVAFYVPAFAQIVGGAAGLMVLLLAVSLVLSMNTATADGARALYGIARDDMTVKQLYHLNRYKVPSRAMTVDMIVNLFLVFFVGNTLAILVAGNLGYLLAHILALTAFLLLRKDRPNWPRPIRASNVWIPIAVLLAAANLVFVIYGVLNPDITGYGTFFDLLVGIGVLLISVLLYIFRRVFQDGKPIALREETPVLPPAGANLA